MKATDDEGYGYLWWTGRSGVRRRTVDWVGVLSMELDRAVQR